MNNSLLRLDTDGRVTVTWPFDSGLPDSGKDALGLIHEYNLGKFCGTADVTKSLDAELLNMGKAFFRSSASTKCELCKGLWNYIHYVDWDINKLNIVGSGEAYFSAAEPGKGGDLVAPDPDSGKQVSACERTVVAGGRCYYAGAMNYAMWGRIHKLCAIWESIDYQSVAIAKVQLYKKYKFKGNLSNEAIEFTRYGYNWPNAPLPEEGGCKSCDVRVGQLSLQSLTQGGGVHTWKWVNGYTSLQQ